MYIFNSDIMFLRFIQTFRIFILTCLMVTLAGIIPLSAQDIGNNSSDVIKVGSRRELFVDDFLVEKLEGKAELLLHHPTPKNIALETNETWEGNGTNYVTVFKDENKYRMYYRACHYSYLEGKDRPSHRDLYCYAESSDGISWIKPELGIISWNGSKNNNIILDGGNENFAPFLDTNPQRQADAKYKALGVRGGSADFLLLNQLMQFIGS